MRGHETGDYYYSSEAEQYSFYRLPKVLFTDSRYKNLSDGAKILYGLMLDRMALSLKNGWLDAMNRVYIYFTLEDVQEYMNCQRDKGMKLLAELDAAKGAGLIERVRQGLGRPTIIYVKKFIAGTDLLKSEKPTSGLPDMPTSGLADTPTPARRKNRPLEVGGIDPNNNKINNTDLNDTDIEYPSIRPPPNRQTDRTEDYRALLMENIGFDVLCERHGRERMDEIMAVLLDAVCSTKQTLRVDGEDKPAEVVKSRLLKLDSLHIEYCIERLDENTTKIRNIKAYLLTTLYNAPATIEHYYRAAVQHDMYGGP